MSSEGKKQHGKVESESLRVSVKESLLRWALDRSDKSVEELSKKPNTKKIDEWLNGNSMPTLRQLEQFAAATFTPFGYLFLSDPPREEVSIPYFRTQSAGSVLRYSPDLIKTVQIIERRQDWIREYLIEDGADPLKFVGSAGQEDSYVETAGKIRKELGVTREWAANCRSWKDALKKLREKIEDVGIFVNVNGIVGANTHRPLDPQDFRGFVLVDDYAPFIFVNSADGKAAQMFTLAHELAHVWLGRSAAFDLYALRAASNKTEMVCNKIAAEFLVQGEEMQQNWRLFAKSSDPFEEAAHHFKVSKIVAARKALDLQIIDQTKFSKFYDEYIQQEQERRKQEQQKRKKSKPGADPYATTNVRIGNRFTRNVITAIKEGKLLYREAYSLTGLRHESFDTYAQKFDPGVGE